MSEYKAIETTELVKIANAIRLKKGGTDKISLEDMPAMIREIEGGGVKLPALTNEAAASELLAGKQLINDEGDVITGAMADNGTIASTMDGLNTKQVTIPAGYTSGGTVSLDNTIDNEVDIQADLLAQAVAALEGKAGGGSEPSLQSKSVTPSAAQQTVVPDSGYDGLSKVTVNAMPTATQATPSISVNSSGLITASATQSAGYVAAGTKSGTKQLITQAAKTITPTKSSQTAVASGIYATGAVTVAAIPGEYITTTDATAVAADMRSGKTAYVNGSKVTGTIDDFDGSYECSGESTGGSGSGGSGNTGDVQTCTVTFTTDLYIGSQPVEIDVTYTNENFEYKSYYKPIYQTESWDSNNIITVLKNTPIFISVVGASYSFSLDDTKINYFGAQDDFTNEYETFHRMIVRDNGAIYINFN